MFGGAVLPTQPKTFITPEQYLEIERAAEYKSEYFNGEMFAMAGASRRHNLIAANALGELRQQLRSRPCEAYMAATCAFASTPRACTPIPTV